MGLVGERDAADRLGVSPRQVRRLAARGELVRVARGVLDEASVDQHRAVVHGAHRRAWSEPTAWAAVGILSGIRPVWMGATQRSRLGGRLRAMTADDLVAATRNRAFVGQYVGHPATVGRLRQAIVDITTAAARLGLAAGAADVVDGYVSAAEVERLVARYGLAPDPAGRIVLRATGMDIEVVRALAAASTVLAALDLAGSLDVRERRAGLNALATALDQHRA